MPGLVNHMDVVLLLGREVARRAGCYACHIHLRRRPESG